MKQIITISILCLLMVAMLFGCLRVSNSNAEIVERVMSQPSSNSIVALAEQIIDSVAMLPIDTLSEDSRRKLPRLVQDICEALKERNQIAAAMAVAAYPYGIDAEQYSEISMRLLTSTLLPGKTAPLIEGLSQPKQRPKYTVVLFHDSACRTCQGMMRELKERYAELQHHAVRLVTISTDTDRYLWEEYAALLPWPDKLCDFRGFQSPVMEAYGVAATPTMYLIDAKWRVIDQYMTVGEIADIVLPKPTTL